MGKVNQQNPAPTARVRELFEKNLIWDNHATTTIRANKPEAMAQLRRHRAAGVDVVTVNVGWDQVPNENPIRLLADFCQWLTAHANEYALIETAADMERARLKGQLGVCFNIEGGNCLYGQLSMISLYYGLGVRWMLFAYNHNNALAGGCQDNDAGLTDFGRAVLTEMERVGMQVCCSHIGEQSALEICQRATRPVIFSHSNPRAVHDHPRNISDQAIRACAKTGGVVGINGIGMFLGDDKLRVDTIVRHIDYVAQLVGPNHVGIGLDFAYDEKEVLDFLREHHGDAANAAFPNGVPMMAPEQLPAIAEALLARGYPLAAVAQIMGGNLHRLANEVWR